ncbi:unnamed protein product [Polarella glacialis]|uniref:Zeta toxin domain-containing protein n=1 Tax=Polarella glacialis TaxID=89957 RepID=A0A813M018_POLGL|nr:unnamed protein product [Polarella glacialis]
MEGSGEKLHLLLSADPSRLQPPTTSSTSSTTTATTTATTTTAKADPSCGPTATWACAFAHSGDRRLPAPDKVARATARAATFAAPLRFVAGLGQAAVAAPPVGAAAIPGPGNKPPRTGVPPPTPPAAPAPATLSTAATSATTAMTIAAPPPSPHLQLASAGVSTDAEEMATEEKSGAAKMEAEAVADATMSQIRARDGPSCMLSQATGTSAAVTGEHAGRHRKVDVEPDQLKRYHPQFSSDMDEDTDIEVHRWSVRRAVDAFEDALMSLRRCNVAFDSCGSNSQWLARRLESARAAGYRTELLWVDVPIEVALLRNRDRGTHGRWCPESVIMDKAKVMRHSFEELRHTVDFVERIQNWVLVPSSGFLLLLLLRLLLRLRLLLLVL